MRIDFPPSSKIHIESSGCQSLRVELSDENGLPFCCLELSLSQARAIAHHLRKSMYPSETTESGWELR